jgi:glycosyltransferase involved in cell wall biosynthesis
LRILALHDPYAPIENGSVGGEDNLANLQIQSLRELGHEVLDGRFSDSGAKRKLNQLRAQLIGTGVNTEKLIKDFKPDVIHTLNLSQRSGYAWMRTVPSPIVSSIHNFRLFCPSSIAWQSGSPCLKCRDGSALNAIRDRCAGLVGAMNASRHLIFQRDYPQVKFPTLFLLASENMRLIFKDVIPQEKMRILRTPSESKGASVNSATIRKGWLFAGRLSHEKGILDLLNIWPDEEELDIAGSGPLSEEVHSLIKEKNNIRMIGTYPPGDHSIFSSYEGMIFPSTWFEGSPLVVMECLGTGTPVISGSVSSAAEQIEITQGGYSYQGEVSREKILRAIKEVRLNFNTYSTNAISNAREVSSVGSWKKNLENYLLEAIELYR